MHLKKAVAVGSFCMLAFAQTTMAQDDLTCDDIEWKPVVTDNIPSIATACDAVLMKNGSIHARVEIELLRVRGRTLTFRVLDNNGDSLGAYTQTVDTDWRAHIGGQDYRPRDLSRGQKLNIYMPSDRWAVIPENAAEEPATEMAVVPEVAPELPKTATPLPLIALMGSGLVALGAGLGWFRRRRG
jgi:LPXTG-motif cell wall-anchored protein